MLDIELFRTNMNKIIESEKRRFKDPSNAEKVLEFDIKLRAALNKLQKANQQLNQLSPQIGKLIKELKIDKKRLHAATEVLENNELIRIEYPPFGSAIIYDAAYKKPEKKKKNKKKGS